MMARIWSVQVPLCARQRRQACKGSRCSSFASVHVHIRPRVCCVLALCATRRLKVLAPLLVTAVTSANIGNRIARLLPPAHTSIDSLDNSSPHDLLHYVHALDIDALRRALPTLGPQWLLRLLASMRDGILRRGSLVGGCVYAAAAGRRARYPQLLAALAEAVWQMARQVPR